jgi:peptide/nickel transport system ATP-binding protein
MDDNVLLSVDRLRKYFPVKKSFIDSLRTRKAQRHIHAVESVSFSVKSGEILGLVGESGSGKTTTGRLLTLLETPDGGTIQFQGRDIQSLSSSELDIFRREVQFVFQNPYDSLDPKFTIFESLEEPLITHSVGRTKQERRRTIYEIMSRVGISSEVLDLYPSRLSGGQRQRIALARAFMLGPKLLIADEPASMLDASVRASILNILVDLRALKGTSVILITHDIATARHVCDRICVMYMGEIVEIADTDEIVSNPLHPYTRALLAAIPRPDPDSTIDVQLTGEIGNSIEPPTACRLNPRCPYAQERCRTEVPTLREIRPAHLAACHRSEELFLKWEAIT